MSNDPIGRSLCWGLCVALGGLGCEPTVYNRAPYAVGSVAGVLYSNVLVVTGEVEPQKAGQSLTVTYPLLFQNAGTEVAQLGLGTAQVRLNGAPERVTARCAEHGRAEAPSAALPPGRRLRVDCELSLNAAGLAEARRSDSELVLSLPILTAGQLVTPEFSFRLSRGDAS